jgi:RNA polymerase sigma factor (sigma-70 family)
VPVSLAEIERIYRTRFPQFLRVAIALTGDRDLGRDAVHEAFVKAIQSRQTLRRAASVDAWLWRILVNSARTESRRTSRHARPFAIESSAEEQAEVGAIREAVAALPERQRTILFLRYYADLDYEAIAEAVGVARGTVAATLHAARATLKERLTEAPR